VSAGNCRLAAQTAARRHVACPALHALIACLRSATKVPCRVNPTRHSLNRLLSTVNSDREPADSMTLEGKLRCFSSYEVIFVFLPMALVPFASEVVRVQGGPGDAPPPSRVRLARLVRRGRLLALALFPGAVANHPDEASNSEITTRSSLLNAIIQNTPVHSEGYPVGVPRAYAWCSGCSKSENDGPPPDFTAVVGWGQVYPEVGATRPDQDQIATIEIANAKTFVRLRQSREWVLVQDQATVSVAGAYFVSDFSPNQASIRWNRNRNRTTVSRSTRRRRVTMRTSGLAHAACIQPEASIMCMLVDMRISDANTKLVANIGAANPSANFAVESRHQLLL
jgi:hypothetical protein